MLRRILGTTASGGILTTILTTGWTGAVVLVAVVFAVIGALCWIVADPKRAALCALLLTAWRHGTTDRPQHSSTPRSHAPTLRTAKRPVSASRPSDGERSSHGPK